MKNTSDSKRCEVKYACAECHSRVVVKEDKIERECEHKHAGVVADISATATGESHVAR